MNAKEAKKVRQYVQRNMVLVSQELIAGMRNLEFKRRLMLAKRILFAQVIDTDRTLYSSADMEAAKKDNDNYEKALKEATANLNQARSMIWALAKKNGGEVDVSIDLLAEAQIGHFEVKHNEGSKIVTVTAK